MFQHIDAYAGDPILSLMEEFSKDTRQNKVNLSIGLYYNEDNIVPQLQSVQKAYTHLIPDYDKVRVYLPMDGLKSFNQAAQELIFGQASPARQQGRVVTIQTLGWFWCTQSRCRLLEQILSAVQDLGQSADLGKPYCDL